MEDPSPFVEDDLHPADLLSPYEGPPKEEAAARMTPASVVGRPEPNILSSQIRELLAYTKHHTQRDDHRDILAQVKRPPSL